jgi:hypothetical protein
MSVVLSGTRFDLEVDALDAAAAAAVAADLATSAAAHGIVVIRNP